jgi:predicted GNAT family N-acyltransferase
VEEYIQKEYQERKMTVNAAPYAVGFYRQIGFEDVAPELTKDGIIYTPMEKSLY